MLKVAVLFIEIASLCLLVTLLNFTTPATAGPFGVLMIFLSFYIIALGSTTFAVYWLSQLVSHLSSVFLYRRPIQRLSLRESYYYSTVIAAAPVILMGLQSVGSISLYEFILVFFFVAIGCLYVSKKNK